MAYLLGIDIGTSGTKTVLFNEVGATVASSLREYPLYQPQIGWAEQRPEDWWDAVVKSISDVISSSALRQNAPLWTGSWEENALSRSPRTPL